MPRTEQEESLVSRVYQDHRLRERVKPMLRKREDVALNAVMLLLAETYLDGARDGAAFGMDAVCREAYTDLAPSST